MPGGPLDTKGERTPLAAAGHGRNLHTLGLGTTTVCLSVGLINFNRYLMEQSRFPYAVPLVLIHMAFCSTLAVALRLVRPSLYPSLTDPVKCVTLDRQFFACGVLPIGAVFAASLVLSNLAYNKLSVAFLQMLKESNIVFVYALSLVVALEAFSWQHVQVIIFAIFAASLTIKGELHFSMSGFLIQLASMLCECVRIVLQSLLLSGRRLDPMSYVLIVSPVCFLLLGGLVALLLLLPRGLTGPGFALPSGDTLWAFAPLLLANCCVAFALNLSISGLLKYTSATSYIFVGVLKDIVAVLVSVLLLGEAVSRLQALSFALQICTVVVWSLMRAQPQHFDRGLLAGLAAVARGAVAPGRGASGATAGAEDAPEAAAGARQSKAV